MKDFRNRVNKSAAAHALTRAGAPARQAESGTRNQACKPTSGKWKVKCESGKWEVESGMQNPESGKWEMKRGKWE